MKRLLSLQTLAGRTVVIPLMPRPPHGYHWKPAYVRVIATDMICTLDGRLVPVGPARYNRETDEFNFTPPTTLGISYWFMRAAREAEVADPRALHAMPDGYRFLFKDEGIRDEDLVFWEDSWRTNGHWRIVAVACLEIPLYRLRRDRIVRRLT